MIFWWNGNSDETVYAPVSPINTWNHYAVVGSNNGVNPASNVIMMYQNGVQLFSNIIPYNVTNSGNWQFTIGAQEGGVWFFDGYITNFRFVSGTALYNTSSITVPSLPLSNIGGTQLLLLANSNAPFLDSSSNNYPLDNVNGGVTWASNGPPV